MDRNIIIKMIVKESPADRRSLPNIAESIRVDPNVISRYEIARIFSILAELIV